MTTGEKIAELRRANGISQEDLAEQLGISRQAVSKWESDIAAPSTENYKELSRLFGVTVDALLYPDEAETAIDTAVSDASDGQEPIPADDGLQNKLNGKLAQYLNRHPILVPFAALTLAIVAFLWRWFCKVRSPI